MTDINIDGGDEFAEFSENLREAAARLPIAIDSGVQTTAVAVERSAKQNAPVDTGTLSRSIEHRQVELGTYVVGTGIEYADDVEFGTRPHPITPDDADALAFEGEDGDLIFRSRVNHPGTPAQPYLRPALKTHQSDLAQNIREAIIELFEDIF